MNNTEKLPYEILELFPMPVYKTNIGREFTKQEQDEFDTIIEKDLKIIPDSKRKSVSTDKYLLKRKPFASIQSFIDHHLKQFAADIMGIFDPNVSLDITSSWLNATGPQQFFNIHDHYNSIISGVFYPKCLDLPGDKSDVILLYRGDNSSTFGPIDINMKYQNDNEFTSRIYRCPVVTGDLILFPARMHHSIELNVTDQTRISLAFNAYLFGVLGDYEMTSELILKQEK